MNTVAIVLVIILVAFTIGLSIFSRRFTRTTADFYLAGRKVGSFANASAISGDYLSAASFLGVAGAVYASGLDGVWYAAGFAGGFMVVVVFIASVPLVSFVGSDRAYRRPEPEPASTVRCSRTRDLRVSDRRSGRRRP